MMDKRTVDASVRPRSNTLVTLYRQLRYKLKIIKGAYLVLVLQERKWIHSLLTKSFKDGRSR